MEGSKAVWLLAAVLALLAASGIAPHDRFTWILEVAPVLMGAAVLVPSWRRFPLTTLLTWLLAAHACVLILGGHYTYARVPLGAWAQEAFGFERNHYDRLGHFAQGFVPAILAREILLRTSPLRPGKWLSFLCACVCLAFSAFYELVEWWTAALTGTAAEAFLGTQGDVWDSQWDMLLALAGAASALLFLSRAHDRQLDRRPSARPAGS